MSAITNDTAIHRPGTNRWLQLFLGIVCTRTNDYQKNKEELRQIAQKVVGISSPPSDAAAPSTQVVSVPGNALGPAPLPVPPSSVSAAAPRAPPEPNSRESAADKLRELNKLYKEGVISQTDF
jgi:hypothetical protein